MQKQTGEGITRKSAKPLACRKEAIIKHVVFCTVLYITKQKGELMKLLVEVLHPYEQ